MTYLEQWKADHPEKNYATVPVGCPMCYGYEESQCYYKEAVKGESFELMCDKYSSCTVCNHSKINKCEECWGREIPKEDFLP